MNDGSELSKTVATFIVQKILLDDLGLTYVCATSERFYAVSSVLSSMVTKLVEAPSMRLLKHLVRCYLRLSENPRYLCVDICVYVLSTLLTLFIYICYRAREVLKDCLPEALRSQAFASILRTEEAVQRWLTTLLKNISDGATVTLTPAHSGGADSDVSQSLSFMTNATSTLHINDASTVGRG